MSRLNYNQLYYFYVIASEGSIKAACNRLHLTQPTLSIQLKTLEESLGRPLFERQHRKLSLNSYGLEVFKRAESIFVIGDEMIASLSNSKTTLRTGIRIGTVPSLPTSFLHDFTLELWKTEAHSTHLTHAPLSDLVDSLDDDKLDLILSDMPYQKSKRYQSVNLGGQKLIAVGTQKFKNCRKDFPQSLMGKPYLGFQKSGSIQSDIDFFFKTNKIIPDLIGSVDDASFIRLVAEKGFCVAILPEQSVSESIKNKRLIKIGELSGVQSSCWAIMSTIGSKKTLTRNLINTYMLGSKKTLSKTIKQ